MPTTFLDVPYLLAEGSDPTTDLRVAAALKDAYTQIKQGKYRETLDTLKPVLSWPMSDRQFVRVHFMRGYAWSHLELFAYALDAFEEAYERAQRMSDLGASAQLAYLRGTNYYYSNQFGIASRCYNTALDTWHDLAIVPEKMTSGDFEFEIDTLIGLGIQQLWLAHYADAENRLLRAGALVTTMPDSAGQSARIEWTLALIQRWRGALRDAYRSARLALEVYELSSALNATSRLRTVLADILLDIADSYSPNIASSARARVLRQVEQHLTRALTEARQSHDLPSEGMVLLTYARYLRATNDQTHDRLAPVETAGQIALGLGDLALLGQAFTGRGDEFKFKGNSDSATKAYRNAIDILTKCGVVALAKWPQRSLRRMQEGLI